jgi:hypothetical protein
MEISPVVVDILISGSKRNARNVRWISMYIRIAVKHNTVLNYGDGKLQKLFVHHAAVAQFAVGPETRTGWSVCFESLGPHEVLAMRLSSDAGNCCFNAYLSILYPVRRDASSLLPPFSPNHSHLMTLSIRS